MFSIRASKITHTFEYGEKLHEEFAYPLRWHFCFFWLFGATQIQAQSPVPITPGDLVVYRVGDGTATLVNSGNAVFVDEYNTSGTLVQSIAMPTTTTSPENALLASGTATSEGLLTVSPDNQYISLTGYDRNIGGSGGLAGTSSTLVPRTVGIIPVATGAPDTTTALTDFASGNNPRSAVTDGTNIWVAGAAGGVRYTTIGSGTSTPLNTTFTNFKQVNIFQSQLFVSTSSGSAGTSIRLGTVGSGVPTSSGQTITNVPGISTTNSTSPFSYFFANLDPTNGFDGTTLDTLYVADDTNNGGEIEKYTFSNTTGQWTANGAIAATAVRGLTGYVDSSGNVDLFGTTGGGGASGGGSLYSLTDSSGYNITINGTSNTLATNPTKEVFRGVAYVGINPSTSTWSGGGGNNNWSPNRNWNTAPSNGNNLIFAGMAQTSNINDTLTAVNSITFDATAGSFTLSGSALSIGAGGITNNSAQAQTVNMNLLLTSAQQFNAANGELLVGGNIANGGGNLMLTGSASTNLSGSVSGYGGIVKSDSGTATLSGNSSYTGGTTVNDGTLIVSHVHGLGQSTTNGLTINNTALVKITTGTGAGPVVLPSLYINGGTSPIATLDLTNSKMVITNTSFAAARAAYTVARAQVTNAFDGFAWDLPGITSSTVANDINVNLGFPPPWR